MLRKLRQALLRLPRPELIRGALCDGEGVCATGALLYRELVDGGMEPKAAWRKIQGLGQTAGEYGDQAEEELEQARSLLGMTPTLAWEVAAHNDDDYVVTTLPETSGQRYGRMMRWLDEVLEA